jgi:tetratricopeptide (TPR) repeat protein
MQQHDHRATTVGETSGGGAHPTRYYPLDAGNGVSIPFARTVNPVTKTNWEGVGVIPDVKCNADEALDKAIALAEVAAKEYKKSILAPLTEKLSAVEDKEISKTDAQEIHELLKSALEANMLTENDINLAGYHYLNAGKLSPALAIFSSNTILFPTSVNVHDSYAEGLAADGQNALALEYYEKAVALAKEQNHRDLEAYERNMKAFKDGLK